MDFFEAQSFFKQMYPGKEIKYEFDEKCHRIHEIIYTDGLPNVVHHVENRQVKVTVDGIDSFYVPIAPHRETYSWADIKKFINSKKDVFIHEEDLKTASKLEDPEKYDDFISQMAKLADLSKDKIVAKIEDYKKR